MSLDVLGERAGFYTFGVFSKYAERLMNTQKEICNLIMPDEFGGIVF
jgi:hypothetical protein